MFLKFSFAIIWSLVPILSFGNLGPYSVKKNDIQAARHLIDMYNDLRRNRVSLKKIKRSHRIIKANHTFSEYSEISYKIIEQLTQNSSKASLKSCLLSYKSKLEPVLYLFDKVYKHYCLDELTNSKQYLSPSDITIVLSNLKLFIYKHEDLFFNLYTKKIPQNHIDQFNTDLVNTLIKEKIHPSSKLVSILKITPELNSYLHKIQFYEQKLNKEFSKEFKRILRSPSSHNNIESSIKFLENNKEYINQKQAFKLLITSGKYLQRSDELTKAVDLFELTEETFENESNFETLFQNILTRLLNHDTIGIINEFEERNLLSQFSQLPNKLKFWFSYSFEKSKEIKKAKGLYKKLIQDNPLNFYSILALQRLQQIQPNYKNSFILKKSSSRVNSLTVNEYGNLTFQKLKTFLKIGYPRFSNAIIRNIFFEATDVYFKASSESQTKLESQKAMLLIKFLSNNNDHLNAFKISYLGLNRGDIKLSTELLTYLFPRKYENFIYKKSNILDPHWVLSLIRQESAFNPYAKSHAGARGLMQLMKPTARMFKKRIKSRELYRTKTNLKIGIKFLERLLKQNEGNLIYTLASYNAGARRVRQWKRDIFKSIDPLINLELIPFKETRNYVKYIYRNFFFYKFMQEDDEYLFNFHNDLRISLNDEL